MSHDDLEMMSGRFPPHFEIFGMRAMCPMNRLQETAINTPFKGIFKDLFWPFFFAASTIAEVQGFCTLLHINSPLLISINTRIVCLHVTDSCNLSV